MMGTTMIRPRPIAPPPGVDAGWWNAEVRARAAAQLAVEDELARLREQQHLDSVRESRRRTRRAIGALLLVAVLLGTIGLQWTLVAGAVIVWWCKGHPGLSRVTEQVSEKSTALVRRRQ